MSLQGQNDERMTLKASACDAHFPAPAIGTTRRPAQRPTVTAEANTAQLKKDCDAKWNANKASTGAHGWHDYFQFMSRCM